METIYIYNGASRLTIPVTDSAERSHSLQQHNYVKLVWKSAENTPISANAYIEYEGQVFYALDDYFPTHKDGIYEYDIEFHAIEDTFNRPLFFRYVDIFDQTTGKITSWKEIEWSLNGNLKTIADIVITCLNRAYNNAYFELPADSYTDTLLMSYSFSGNSIADALSTIAEQNETEWWLETTAEYVDGKRKYILHFDKCEIGTTIELNDHYTEDANGVWQSGGLKSVSQSGNTNIIPQKLFIYGSERNIIKKTVEEETEDGKMNVSYDKKLRLPSIFPNGTKEHVIESAGVTLSLNDDSSISIGGINNHFEQFKIFDEVYPKMDMEVTAVSVQNPNSENPIYWLKGDRLKSITTESPVDGSINPGKLGLLIEGCTLMCTFTSGLLNGREFECAWRESSAEIGLIPIDENDVQIPSGVYKPNVGDTFILWNLAMPQSSITIAQNELCVEAINYIEELATSITETDCTTEAEATRISGLNTKIKVGQRISVNSNVFRNGRLLSRIIKYSYKLTTPYDVNFTLASSRQTGRLAALENMIADVTHEVHAVNQVQQAISRRQWHDTEEMMSMLDSIQKQMVVVGDENNAFGTTCSLKYNSDTKQLLVSEGYVLHQSFTDNDFNGQWNIDSFTRDMSAIDPDGKTPFYVFFVCPKSKETAEKGYTDVASALPMYDDYYVFILGILSSEFEGKRAFNQTNGITSIAGGNVTTNVIQDPGQRLIVDFANATITARNGATIKGAIQFEKGEGENDLGTALEDLLNGLGDVENKVDNLEVGGRNLITNSISGKDWFTLSGSFNVNNGEFCLINNNGSTDGGLLFSPKTMNLKSGENYTLSFEMKGSNDIGYAQIRVINFKEGNSYENIGIPSNIQINKEDIFEYWTKYTFKFTVNKDVTQGCIRFDNDRGDQEQLPTELWLRKVKFEKGTIATDWTPAPEDVEQAIIDAEDRMGEDLASAVETINGGIEALQKQVDGEVNSWFMEGEPSNNYRPASEWNTQELRERHLGDTYTNILPLDVNFSDVNVDGQPLWIEQGGLSVGSSHYNKTYTEQRLQYTNYLRSKSIFDCPNTSTSIVIKGKNVPSGTTFKYMIVYYNESKQYFANTAWQNGGVSINVTYKGAYYASKDYAHYFAILCIIQNDSTEAYQTITLDNLDSITTSGIFTNPAAGLSWRWCNYNDEDNTTFHWHKIADSDAVKALAEAAKAQSTADGKSTTFIVQPSNYSKGDLWILASATTVNGTSYKAGTILTANEASATYVASHWGEKVKYTDDELAKKAEQDAANAQEKANQASLEATNAQNRMNNWASDSNFSKLEQQGLEDEKRKIEADKSDIDKECEKYILTSDTTYTEYVTAYNTIIGQLNSVVTSLDTNDYIAIPQNFSTNHQTYYDKRTLVLERISDRADEVANEYADKKVGEIEIGGTNILPHTQSFIDNSALSGNGELISEKYNNFGVRYLDMSSTSTSSFNTFVAWNTINTATNNDEFTCSFYAKGSGKVQVFLYSNSYNGLYAIKTITSQGKTWTNIDGVSIIDLTDTWTRYWVTWKLGNPTSIVTRQNNLLFRLYGGNSVYLCGCQLEKGNKATAWKPNDADIINATENILKDSFLIKMSSGSKDKWTYTQFNLSTPLKPNTEYVFSVFKSTAKSDNASANNTATKFTIRIMDSNKSVSRLMTNIAISTTLQIYKFITPASVVGTDVVLIYNGQVDNENGGYTTNGTIYQNTTFYGLMLAEGNVYSPWKAATPEEEESLYLLKDAIAGSTEIEGGLVLTNLIELKNQSGEVTAGINGLDTTQGGVDNALRFWAGGSLGSSSSAPFRVYDDGRVFGTHFYGFFSAFEVNNSNKNTYIVDYKLDFAKTGGSVLLNFSTLNIAIGMPDALDYLGSEVEIYNPKRLGLAFCNQMPDYTKCNIDNMFDSYIGSSLSGYYYTDYYWKMVKMTCSKPSTSPLYMKFKCMVVPLGSNGFASSSSVSNCYTVQYNGIFYYVPVWILVEKID